MTLKKASIYKYKNENEICFVFGKIEKQSFLH